jgi:hypothetical protein
MVCDIGVSNIVIDENSLTHRGRLNVLSMVEVDDMLRPRDTKWFRKFYSEKPYDFPYQEVLGQNAVWTKDPMSTRATLQNVLLKERYFNK